MNRQVDTAVILAAGLGSRLGDLNENKPKAFLKIGGESLIERSIRLLLAKGITRIIIGTGYGSTYFDDLRLTYPEVTTHRNPKFESTGSMYTLYLLKEFMQGTFLLLEGDLLYESDALKYLLEDVAENIILTSDATNSGDEVFIQSDDRGYLVNMSKMKSKLDWVNGELVGISKLSLDAFRAMAAYSETRYKLNEYNVHYEDAFVGISKETDLLVKIVNDMAWCEIDDASHLKRATSNVYPRILAKEGK